MRVISANNYYYLRGGSERVFFGDMHALESEGVEVIPFSAIDPANDQTPHARNFVRAVDVQAKGAVGKLRAAVEAVYCRRTAQAFDRLLQETAPDVVHCHNIYGRLTTSILNAAARRRIPVVLTAHDYKLVCPAYLMLRDQKPCDACIDGGYYRCATNRCHKGSLASSAVYAAEAYFTRFARQYGKVSAFLCPSQFMTKLFRRAGLPADRVFYHPNSIDAGAYSPNFEPGEYALYVGRLSAEKGIATLLQAIASTGIPLRIAGDGPMGPALQQLAQQNPATPIVFEGTCRDERLRKLYQNAAFIVVPSEWYENAPMTVLEAFAYGKPVIASAIGGLPEMVIDGETGYLFPYGDREYLEATLRHLWSDRAGQRRMGQNARRKVESDYSQSSRLRSLIEHYNRVCHAGAHASGLQRAPSLHRSENC